MVTPDKELMIAPIAATFSSLDFMVKAPESLN